MPANISATIKKIIEFQDLFFEMLDDQAKESIGYEGFLLPRYKYAMNRFAETIPEKSDKDAFYDTLGFSNLRQCELVVEFDNHSGRFFLKQWLIDMLRELDSRRMLSLPEATLESMRLSLATLSTKMKDPISSWHEDTQDGIEFRRHTVNLTGQVLSTIVSNIQALKGQSTSLAEIAKDASFFSLNHAQRQMKALNEIEHIYLRNVIPTLAFLNPYATDESAITALNDISKQFTSKQRHSELATIRRRLFALAKCSREVQNIQTNLKDYLPLLESQRRIYDRIEERFNKLKNVVVEKMSGRKSGSRITPSDLISEDMKPISGLKVFNSSFSGTRLNMITGQGRLHIDEYIRVKGEDFDSTEVKEFVYLTPPAIDYTSRMHARIMQRLSLRMANFSMPDPDVELFGALHEYLVEKLNGYTLSYLIEAASLLPVKPSQVHQFTETTRTHLEHGKYRLSYYPRYITVKGETE